MNNIASMMFYRHASGGSWIRGRQSAQVGHTNRRVEYQGPYHPIMLSPSRAVILAEAGMSKRTPRSGCTSTAALRSETPSAPASQPTRTADGSTIPSCSAWRTNPRHYSCLGRPGAIPAVRNRRVYPLRQLLLRHLRHRHPARGKHAIASTLVVPSFYEGRNHQKNRP